MKDQRGWVEWLARDERVDIVWGMVIIAAFFAGCCVVVLELQRNNWSSALQATLVSMLLLRVVCRRG